MLAQIYKKNIVEKPKFIFVLLIFCLLFFGYNSKHFRLDASSDTLLIEDDPDLKYLNEVNQRYGAKEFLVLTYTPKEDITSDNSVNNLLSLKYKLQSLDWVHGVITILDLPLLNIKDETLTEKLQNFSTLKSEGVDREEGFNEILNSPVFRNFVISEDGKTTGIIVNNADNVIKELFEQLGFTSEEKQGNYTRLTSSVSKFTVMIDNTDNSGIRSFIIDTQDVFRSTALYSLKPVELLKVAQDEDLTSFGRLAHKIKGYNVKAWGNEESHSLENVIPGTNDFPTDIIFRQRRQYLKINQYTLEYYDNLQSPQ